MSMNPEGWYDKFVEEAGLVVAPWQKKLIMEDLGALRTQEELRRPKPQPRMFQFRPF